MTLKKFKELLETSNISVFHHGQNSAEFPYVIFTETGTNFKYASGYPCEAVTDVYFTLYTHEEFDVSQFTILNLLIENRVTITAVRYGYNSDHRVFTCTFIVKIKHGMDYQEGDIDYIGSL